MSRMISAAPQVEADPNQMYPVTPQSGTWLVCAASYTGSDGKELARQRVHWIRTKYNAPAFTYNRADEERKRLNDEYAQRGVRKSVRIEDQFAVFVGGYNDIETASKAREVIRKWPLPDLKLDSGKSAYDLEVTQEFGPKGAGKQESKAVNPFLSAIPIRNPLVAKQTATSSADYAFMKKLNDGEEFSLLANPKPWTLAVKQYMGASVVTDQPVKEGVWDRLFGNSKGEALDAGERQAHEMARVLRKLGFQAWVLHAKQTSVVTIGGFDAIDDPEMEKTRLRLTQLTQQIVASSANKSDPLGLFASPPPMQVPRPEK